MRGEVHDPRAYVLGGVAGHAGLFSTADDLLLYARMILDGGKAAIGPAGPEAGDGQADDHAAAGARRAAGARLGRGHRVLPQPRRPVPAGQELRPHRLHRHVDLDRSRLENGGRVPEQPRASGRQGQCDAAPRAGGDDRRGGGGVQTVTPDQRLTPEHPLPQSAARGEDA